MFSVHPIITRPETVLVGMDTETATFTDICKRMGPRLRYLTHEARGSMQQAERSSSEQTVVCWYEILSCFETAVRPLFAAGRCRRGAPNLEPVILRTSLDIHHARANKPPRHEIGLFAKKICLFQAAVLQDCISFKISTILYIKGQELAGL